ncbi:hypothetical protein PHYBLDRAFT_79490 [Phycomyces blakesleeanus NRRL 1555(-)]|uniref:Uncharacterized protein n=1 Tax=Phycomyces blakesleeanus (strain ATCC 8743b / DSM 1359 / FGSC 10004 / NBRC 33097 / NRRL 1555) TaxID=763407 RepID=A0A167K9J2_PHYB8|nr:hypothetical protein PHYBLDRAFT_79490 [Phycomyces blakesleeanus NRRL 1555(-)]OAD67546.1 hypothetical protein PHYBLDRAFT_79490 [Phycomyces blakesleeanus NRRL 1555(-)]|eukprot:XP_018285586.1 hypothetical protein PHYBLDRAFT_79490 [Phycomyces blakesleeanus NRRL 1555(-)]
MKITIVDSRYNIPTRYLRLRIPNQRGRLLFLWPAISKFNKYIKVGFRVNRMTWNMWHRQSLTQIKPIAQRHSALLLSSNTRSSSQSAISTLHTSETIPRQSISNSTNDKTESAQPNDDSISESNSSSRSSSSYTPFFESQLGNTRHSLSGETSGLRRCKTHYANLYQYFAHNIKT